MTVDTYAWDPFGPNPAMGLSAGWAQNASFRTAQDPTYACSINGLSTTDPAYPQATRWELVGYKQNPSDYSGSYTYANTFALGWSDCKNVAATEYPIPAGKTKTSYAYAGALYRAYPPAADGFGGNAYGTFASFSFKDASPFDNVEGLR